MEQRLMEHQRVQYAKKALANARAMEKAEQRPQLMEYNAEIDEDKPMRGSGGEAGLRRLVGRGKHKKAGGSDGVMKGKGVISDLNIPIVSGIASIFGLGKKGKRKAMDKEEEMSSDEESGSEKEMVGGARHQGKMLGKHLMSLHGAGFLDDFLKGVSSVARPIANIASLLPGTYGTIGKVASGILGGAKKPRGRPRKMAGGNAPHQATTEPIGHATMTYAVNNLPGAPLGGADVPPGGIAPVTMGNAPQAPASFKRNTVGMGRKRKQSPEEKMEGAGKKRSARGEMISKLMRERGMTLPEASRYIKEHGCA